VIGVSDINPATRSVDLRILISEHYGFDFERRVRESNSNSLAAIYFTVDQLETIARDLNVDHVQERDRQRLVDGIREACETERDAYQLDFRDLVRLVEAIGLNVADDLYYDLDGGHDRDRDRDSHERDEDTTGVWSGWSERA